MVDAMASKTTVIDGAAPVSTSMPINISDARKTSGDEQKNATATVKRLVDEVLRIQGAFKGYDLLTITNEKLKAILELDVKKAVKDWLEEGDTNVLNGKTTPLTHEKQSVTKMKDNGTNNGMQSMPRLDPRLSIVIKEVKVDSPTELHNELYG